MKSRLLLLAMLTLLAAGILLWPSPQHKTNDNQLSQLKKMFDVIPAAECADCENVHDFCWDASFFYAAACTVNHQGDGDGYNSCFCKGMRYYKQCMDNGNCGSSQKVYGVMQEVPGCFTQQ